jgi:uncharacterized membrane protein YfcA
MITSEHLAFLTAGIMVVAFLYSAVGHAGASGYIAVMSLLSVAPAVIKPTALVLNIMVATIGAFQFWRAGHFSWQLFWPFALLSIPCAFLGGYINLPTHVFKVLVGIILLLSAVRFFVGPGSDEVVSQPRTGPSIAIGAGLGLLSGLTGTGGGIFLTPLLLFMRWARTKTVAAVSAMFILVNSVSGLLGSFTSTGKIPPFALTLAIAAVVGGTAGSYLGSQRLNHTTIKRLLSAVLIIAGVKLIFTS